VYRNVTIIFLICLILGCSNNEKVKSLDSNIKMNLMKLDVNEIKPKQGKLSCNLFENKNTGLPLHLNYTIVIPIEPFNSGHHYVSQPVETEVVIEWIQFISDGNKQEDNWTNLLGNTYLLTYDNKTAEGSFYLGSEHCPTNSKITFLSLKENVFEIELEMAVSFNISTVNLPENGLIKIKTSVEFEGLILYDSSYLPTLEKINNPINVLGDFIDLDVYEKQLEEDVNNEVDYKLLRPTMYTVK